MGSTVTVTGIRLSPRATVTPTFTGNLSVRKGKSHVLKAAEAHLDKIETMRLKTKFVARSGARTRVSIENKRFRPALKFQSPKAAKQLKFNN